MLSCLEKHSKIPLALTIITAITIFYISSLTFPPGSPAITISFLPTLYHISAFFFFTLFLSIYLIKGKFLNKTTQIVIISILYAILDEIHQYFVPGRFCSVTDVLLDTIGIFSALVIYIILIKLRKK